MCINNKHRHKWLTQLSKKTVTMIVRSLVTTETRHEICQMQCYF